MRHGDPHTLPPLARRRRILDVLGVVGVVVLSVGVLAVVLYVMGAVSDVVMMTSDHVSIVRAESHVVMR